MTGSFCDQPAGVLAGWIAKRSASARDVCEAALARVDALDPGLGAFSLATPAIAREAADAIDRKIARGETVGPLAGVPFSVKDLIFTAGVPTSMGSALYRNFVPEADDIAVERMKAAGAVMLGKTNTSELGFTAGGGNPVFPPTKNPWRSDLTPGGSSAGAAVAVATGMGPVALGSDGGGSIRIPAACCGTVGFKPSMGRVPLHPGCRDERFPGSSSFESVEHIGPITRTVADAALLLDVLAGPDGRDRHSRPREVPSWLQALNGPLGRLRIAFTADWGFAAIEPEIRGIVGDAARVFAAELGCEVEPASPDLADPAPYLAALEALETDLPGLRALANGRRAELSPAVLAMVDRRWTADEFCDALTMRKALCNRMARFMTGFDLLLTPTLAVAPFPAAIEDPAEIDGRCVAPGDWTPFTAVANLTGQPAISVPAGWTANGLPVGLQIIGRHLEDARVLAAAAAFETVRPWARRWPPAVDDRRASGDPNRLLVSGVS